MVIQSDLREDFVVTNNIKLHVVKAGDAKNPMLLLLHGFPEFWYGWKNQIDFFVQAGYYVVMPDQRGYNLSDKPRWARNYSIDKLADDIIGLLDQEPHNKVSLISHDWGGQVAWYLVSYYPERFDKFIILNSPHPRVFGGFIKNDPEQRRKSNYMFKMQWPFLPERRLRKDNYELMKKGMVKFSNPGTFTEKIMEKYVDAWSQKRALTGSINWYRAIRHSKMAKIKIVVPTLIIWGTNDAFLKTDMAQPSADYCENARVEYFEDATHWILHEIPDKVNPLMLRFLNDKNNAVKTTQ